MKSHPEPVHLQLEDEIGVVERCGQSDQVCRCEVRKRQSDFSVSDPAQEHSRQRQNPRSGYRRSDSLEEKQHEDALRELVIALL